MDLAQLLRKVEPSHVVKKTGKEAAVIIFSSRSTSRTLESCSLETTLVENSDHKVLHQYRVNQNECIQSPWKLDNDIFEQPEGYLGIQWK